MISDYPCPLCKFRDWKPVQRYIYKAADHSPNSLFRNDRIISLVHYLTGFARSFIYASPKPKRIRERLLNSYERLRREVLFRVWFPDKQEIAITSQYCLNCGFMAYSPRPDENDISEKYRFLGEHSRPEEIEEYNSFLENDPYSKSNREHIYNLVMGGLKKENIRILDCGGASGWFVVPFAEHGCQCDLVDYETGQVAGIRKVGNNIHELNEKEIYDAIVCRAVLEHIADPLSVVKMFRNLLKKEGLVYAMVPCEIHAGIARLGYDPVTHINAFTPNSFEALFRLADFEVSSGADEMSNIWILAGKRAEGDMGISDFKLDIEKYLYPGRWETLKKYVLNRINPFK
ncbi:MAG: class I SAM-dependent methyltransferase [Candidatus Latescibacter sp.]|nr:class I SAM-dependent methyltransferase [Candidatus Latescibacter sp.]